MTREARVREGTPADEPALRALQTHLPEPSPDLLAHGLRTGDVLVSLADGVTVGYLLRVGGGTGGMGRTNEGGEPDESSRTGVHLAELVVRPDHRREGRAGELLQRAIDAAIGSVTLFVDSENGAAIALYRGFDFTVSEEKPGFYPDGDALVMVRDPDTASDQPPRQDCEDA